MLFNSIEFLIFFPLVTGLYFLIPHKYRWFLLLLSSCIFYMTFIPVYILILAVTIIVDYFAGIIIARNDGARKRLFLIVSIISNVGFLFVFKYFNFFNGNMTHLAQFLHWNYPIKSLSIILPIGLSFHTFQSMSYIIEVYRGKQSPERNFGIYALYVMFYPQLVAGPIERPQNLLHQFREKHYFDYVRVAEGLKLIVWGLFKKIVIADNLAIVVNSVYNDPRNHTGIPLIVATFFFAFQILCDFSGYTDIARGTARVMGFKLMENFNRPYFSKSISEFWKRWHISLSSWFKDYVYISLGGNRVSKVLIYRNLMIVFLLSGLWHGANWTYIIWGGLNGFYLVSSIWTQGIRNRISNFFHMDKFPLFRNFIKVSVTFCLICFSWIFFRAKSMSDALYIITHMFRGLRMKPKFDSGVGIYELLIGIVLIAFLLVVNLVQRKTNISQSISKKPLVVRWSLYYLAITVIILLASVSSSSFIYFQF